MVENKINIEHPNYPGVSRRDWAITVPPGCQPAGQGAISAWVAGVPAPQGSKRGYARQGLGGKLHVSLVESSERVKPWREDIRSAFDYRFAPTGEVCAFLPGVALIVKIVFVMPRPKSTPKTKATPAAVKKPDLDKLIRAVLDALTSAGVYADDSQVVTVTAHKRLAELGEPTGAMIHVEPVQAVTGDLRAEGECAHGGYTDRCGVPGGHGLMSTIDTPDTGNVGS